MRWQKGQSGNPAGRAMTHGHSRRRGKTPEYGAWANMVKRCENQNDHDYGNYGARGITVCERWHSFSRFFADLGERPSRTHTLGRIDNEQSYEPGNCRWETRTQQNGNRRNSLLLTFSGKTQCLRAWARERGVGAGTLQYRYHSGWSVNEILEGR